MDNRTRLEATKYIWVAIGVALAFLFLSAGIGEGLQVPHVVLGIAALIAATGSTGFVWGFGEVANTASAESHMSEQEKVKRERIDSVLRDLSSDELIALKNRLSDGSIDDDLLYEQMTLSDDGELIPMERK